MSHLKNVPRSIISGNSDDSEFAIRRLIMRVYFSNIQRQHLSAVSFVFPEAKLFARFLVTNRFVWCMLIAVSDKLRRQTGRAALGPCYSQYRAIRLRQLTTCRLVTRSIITRFPRNLGERTFISFLDGAPLLRKPPFRCSPLGQWLLSILDIRNAPFPEERSRHHPFRRFIDKGGKRIDIESVSHLRWRTMVNWLRQRRRISNFDKSESSRNTRSQWEEECP